MPIDPNTPPVGVTKLYGQNIYYIVIISSSIYGTVQAWLPEQIVLEIASHWGFVVATEDLSAGASWFFSGLSGGVVPTAQYLTAQAWRGSTPLNLDLNLSFFATEDAYKEVIEPIKKLIKMTLPRRQSDGSIFLIPPGPKATPGWLENFLSGFRVAKGEEDLINVYIGNFIRLKGVFISSVAPSFKGRLTAAVVGTDIPAGLPTEGECKVSFRTLNSPVSQDIDEFILSSGAVNDRPITRSSTGGTL